GGGRPCLRLRAVRTAAQMAAFLPSCLLQNAKIDRLTLWVNTFYRDRPTL
ncbi:N-succinylarginine dihydrolase, partial [Plesiomonas shigelloides]|nr:N-succinylarginine dihydrolase [Plesiomonas shigelloides]